MSFVVDLDGADEARLGRRSTIGLARLLRGTSGLLRPERFLSAFFDPSHARTHAQSGADVGCRPNGNSVQDPTRIASDNSAAPGSRTPGTRGRRQLTVVPHYYKAGPSRPDTMLASVASRGPFSLTAPLTRHCRVLSHRRRDRWRRGQGHRPRNLLDQISLRMPKSQTAHRRKHRRPRLQYALLQRR